VNIPSACASIFKTGKLTMNNNNSEVNGMVFALALIGAALASMAIFAVAFLTIYSIFLSFFCFRAWNKPYKFLKWMIYPLEARAYVYSGIAGFVAAPFLAALASSILNFRIEDQYVPLIMLGGYGVASNISGWITNQMEAEIIADYNANNPPPSIPAEPEAEGRESEAQATFEFASWDDEEKR
jgi:hypothetical protein